MTVVKRKTEEGGFFRREEGSSKEGSSKRGGEKTVVKETSNDSKAQGRGVGFFRGPLSKYFRSLLTPTSPTSAVCNPSEYSEQ